MSVYTEFQTKEIRLRKDTPEILIEFIERCFKDNTWKAWEIAEGYRSPIFQHQLFREERWMRVFQDISFPDMTAGYIHSHIQNRGNHYILFIWTDINYGIDEITQFIDWISPYVAGHKMREYIRWRRTEGTDRLNLYIERPETKRHISETLGMIKLTQDPIF